MLLDSTQLDACSISLPQFAESPSLAYKIAKYAADDAVVLERRRELQENPRPADANPAYPARLATASARSSARSRSGAFAGNPRKILS